MSELTKHYRQLLGLDAAWEVSDVALCLEENRVEILVTHRGGPVVCPECSEACSIADHAPERTWRHLDTMQFETRLRARTPRANCQACGVKTTVVPWAGKHSRFTLLFEAFAIGVIRACGNVKSAAQLIGLDWDSVHSIMERAVERGLERRELEAIDYVGIDEKSFRRGHNYVSLLRSKWVRTNYVSKDVRRQKRITSSDPYFPIFFRSRDRVFCQWTDTRRLRWMLKY